MKVAPRALAALALLAACSEKAKPAPAANAAGGASGAAGAAADASDWDPVWHLTEPKEWPKADGANLPDCGAGCRLALGARMVRFPWFTHSSTTKRVLATSAQGVLFARVGESDTFFAPRETDGPSFIGPYVHGDFMSTVRNLGIGTGRVEVTSLVTGETKVAFEYTPETHGANNGLLTALNSTHVFWQMQGHGIFARDLETGESKQLHAGAPICFGFCATETGVYCTGSVVRYFDQEKSELELPDYDDALQVEGFCSPGRKQLVWIDYRDPPGRESGYDFNRTAGEVYLRDLEEGVTRRLTFDSPSNPTAKRMPAVDGTLVVWSEPADPMFQNPSSMGGIIAAATRLVRLDLVKNQKCRLLAPHELIGFRSLHGRHVYEEWLDPATGQDNYLIDVDLDEPSFVWECESAGLDGG